MKRAIITVGMGFGDEGKGATVDYLCRQYKADLVVRYCGGSQCGHNVQLPNGKRHTFSQFGSGYFAGARTYLGPAVIINPYSMMKERMALDIADREECYGEGPRFNVDKNCLVSTIYHQVLNRLKEMTNQHGTCGHGIGETRKYWLDHGNDAIFVRDLVDKPTLQGKMELMRQRFLTSLDELELAPLAVKEEMDLIRGMREEIGYLQDVLPSIHLVDGIPDYETAIFEGAQGVLLDEYYGFHPHTTWSTVTPHHALELIESGVGYCILGITRSYMTRHGNGPMPTRTGRMQDIGNPWNRWQGNIARGVLDMPLLRYAKEVIGNLDGIVVNHLDEFDGKVCTKYRHTQITKSPFPSIEHSELMRRRLSEDVVIEDISQPGMTNLLNKLAPVVIEADGPTWEHRKLKRFMPWRI